MTESTAGMVFEITLLCVCRSAVGLMCCFDVWFVAQFLRDKRTAADFGLLPRFTNDRGHAVFCTHECKFEILLYPLR